MKASLQHKPVVLFVQETIIVDALLVATGRSPNVSGLGLDAAGVQYSAKDGIKVRHHKGHSQGILTLCSSAFIGVADVECATGSHL